MTKITNEAIEAKRNEINAAFAERDTYEDVKESSASIFKVLATAKSIMTHDAVVAFFAETDKDVLFINRQSTKTNRTNAKALVKIANVALALATQSARALDSHTLLILRNALNLSEKHDKREFSYDELQSLQTTRVSSDVSSKLKKNDRSSYTANTASSQTSSSIIALREFALACDTDESNARHRIIRINVDDSRLAFMNAK